ncbi:MAG: hypothetical protein Q7R39_07140, partial [Dehalococcoidia bacterium]|nr:hypothetical protein [Dehalococcoidia bacterium]
YPPEQDYDINNSTTPVGLYFRRAELQHEAWLRATGQDVAIWVTEFGWIQDFGWNCTWADAGVPWGRQAQKVSPQQQGDYLVRAFQYAQAHWPWMGPMIIFNLDKAVGTPAACDNNYDRFFGILNPNGSPTPAYTALKAMSKTDILAPVSAMGALPAFSPGSFTVSWSGADNPGGAGVQSYDVQRQVDSGTWTDLLAGAILTNTLTSGSDGQRLLFRVRALDRLGNRESYRSEDGDVSTTVDASPPASEVLAYSFPVTSTTWFPARWSGADSGSGMGSYDIQYRDGPTGAWTNLTTSTALTQTTFYSGQDRHTYQFRSRSRDRAGNLEEYPTSPDSQMLVSVSPYITSTTTASSWMGQRGQTLPPQILRLTNAGASSTPYQASSNASWLSVTPTSGSIAPGATVSLSLSVTTPLTGAGTSKLDASVTVTGTAAWNNPLVFSSSLYAVDSLHTSYFPVLPKQASSW